MPRLWGLWSPHNPRAALGLGFACSRSLKIPSQILEGALGTGTGTCEASLECCLCFGYARNPASTGGMDPGPSGPVIPIPFPQIPAVPAAPGSSQHAEVTFPNLYFRSPLLAFAVSSAAALLGCLDKRRSRAVFSLLRPCPPRGEQGWAPRWSSCCSHVQPRFADGIFSREASAFAN